RSSSSNIFRFSSNPAQTARRRTGSQTGGQDDDSNGILHFSGDIYRDTWSRFHRHCYQAASRAWWTVGAALASGTTFETVEALQEPRHREDCNGKAQPHQTPCERDESLPVWQEMLCEVELCLIKLLGRQS